MDPEALEIHLIECCDVEVPERLSRSGSLAGRPDFGNVPDTSSRGTEPDTIPGFGDRDLRVRGLWGTPRFLMVRETCSVRHSARCFGDSVEAERGQHRRLPP